MVSPRRGAPKRKADALDESTPATNGVAPAVEEETTKKATATKTMATRKGRAVTKTETKTITITTTAAAAAAKPKRPAAAPTKKARASPKSKSPTMPKAVAPKAATKTKPAGKPVPILTTVPSDRVHVFACGTGEYGELGLGPSPKSKTVGRPRLNALLPIDSVGVVAVAYGGMHGMALTYDAKVYTWGVNDLGALGRITKAKDEKLKDADADSSDSEDEEEVPLNEDESTPKLVEFPEGTVITRIAAGDSLSLAVTNLGQVYGWGTFRVSPLIPGIASFSMLTFRQTNDGVLGFSESVRIQQTPVLVDNLKNIVNVVCGNDHALALDVKGKAWAWGNGQQNQLGRRVVERTRMNGLRPRELGIPRKKVKSIHTGSFHSFAITTDDLVYSWGLNSFAQCGIYEEAKDDMTTLVVPVPTRVRALDDKDVIQVEGGDRHSIALTSKGELLAWGRMDAHQVGISHEKLPVEDVILDVSGKPRCLIVPHKVCDGEFGFVASGSNHSIALNKEDGAAYSWGFGDLFQCGQGPSGVDVPVPTKIENTATRDVHMIGAACGGQVTILAGIPAPAGEATTNGV